MNAPDAKKMAVEYSVSWYRNIDRPPTSRVYAGKGAPHKTNDDLVHGMQDNIDEAQEALGGVRRRYEEAERLSLFDRDVIAGLDKKTRAEVIAAVEVQVGDRARAISELRHWCEYHALALAGKLPLVHIGLRELAEMKSLTRETQEQIDARENAARNRIQHDLESRLREPGEDDE